MFNVKIFSERLKAARTSKHISQADLAKAVGVSAATISSYETVNGAKIPSLDKAEAIANELIGFVGMKPMILLILEK